MVQEQYTTKRRKEQHLKLIERGKMEALLKTGMSKVKIAQELGISVRTLHREIKRGMVELLKMKEIIQKGTVSKRKLKK